MGDRNTEPVGTVQQLQTDHDRDRAALLVPASADGKTASGYQLSCAKYTRALHNPGDLVELARVVETGDSFLQAGVSGKLQLITEQIKMLQAQARQVLEEGKRDVMLNHARANFQRRPGLIYHLYNKKVTDRNGGTAAYWSMLSPTDYGGKPPHEHVGSFRLEADMSWTPVSQMRERDEKRRLDPQLLGLTEYMDGPGRADGTQLRLALDIQGNGTGACQPVPKNDS